MFQNDLRKKTEVDQLTQVHLEKTSMKMDLGRWVGRLNDGGRRSVGVKALSTQMM